MGTNLRRCGGCKNMVGAESRECPVCGLTRGQIALRRIVRWSLILILLCVVWIALGGR